MTLAEKILSLRTQRGMSQDKLVREGERPLLALIVYTSYTYGKAWKHRRRDS